MAITDRRNIYRAGEVGKILEMSKKTLYALEAQGLIPRVPRDWRGWRVYDDSHLEAVRKYQASKYERRTE
jgi:DNA-binding transcriptional MerR regulator